MRLRTSILIPFLLLAVSHIAPAQLGNKPGHVMPPPPAEWNDIPAPVVLPENALSTFTIDDRFRIEMIASEPLVEDPVCIAYDADGRMWVCEMRGFMPDVRGTGEEDPVGNIVILEDTDGDGTADKRTVFLDGIVLPRALAHVEGGILYADHTTLYSVPIVDGKAGTREVIDAGYAPNGAIEHKPNGLSHGLDNWIYSAKSSNRYRCVNKEWVKEETEFRGQWGISQDDQGRLLTNTNSNLVNLELLPPGTTIRNPNLEFDSKTSANTPSNDVYPIRVTCGINRGYMFGMLTDEGRLSRATAACGPVVYRGDNFPPEFYGNLFIPEPAGLLVKRVVVSEHGFDIRCAFAYVDKEFFASTDERSRIVNAYTAPDGTLHLVDFYRGILQHGLYISTYLHDQILHRGLDKHTGRGRIYRIVSKEKAPGPAPRLAAKSSLDLVPLLSHPNGWWRDTAQRLIVQRGDRSAVPALVRLVENSDNPLARIHALWTLEGLDALTPTLFRKAVVSTNDPKVLAQLIRVAGTRSASANSDAALATLRAIARLKPRHSLTDLHLAISLGQFPQPEALPLLSEILAPHRDDPLLIDAAISGIAGRETELLALHADAPSPLQSKLIDTASRDKDQFDAALALLPENLRAEYARKIADRDKPKENLIKSQADKAQYALGKIEYEKICVGCHQSHGKGQDYLAPPLVDSEWVQGDTRHLISIVLDGMTGPVTVAGKKYDAPNIQPLMPGLRENPELTDDKLAAILTYVRNTWGNAAPPIPGEAIARRRALTADRAAPYTEVELKKL